MFIPRRNSNSRDAKWGDQLQLYLELVPGGAIQTTSSVTGFVKWVIWNSTIGYPGEFSRLWEIYIYILIYLYIYMINILYIYAYATNGNRVRFCLCFINMFFFSNIRFNIKFVCSVLVVSCLKDIWFFSIIGEVGKTFHLRLQFPGLVCRFGTMEMMDGMKFPSV